MEAAQHLLYVFLRNPDKIIANVESVVTRAAGYSKYISETLQVVENLRATDLRLQHALRVAVRNLNRIAIKVLEYIDMADGVSKMANQKREAMVREEIKKRSDDVLDMDDPQKWPQLPELEDFLEELNSRMVSMDTMHSAIVNLCDQLADKCKVAFDTAEEKESEAGKWKSMLGTVTLMGVLGGLGFVTGGFGFMAASAASIATNAAVGTGAVGLGAASISGALKTHKTAAEFADQETDFHRKKESFDRLRRDSNALQSIVDEVEVSHSDHLQTEVEICRKRCNLENVLEFLTTLCQKLQSVDCKSARKMVEDIRKKCKNSK
jgi:hypothetical protein